MALANTNIQQPRTVLSTLTTSGAEPTGGFSALGKLAMSKIANYAKRNSPIIEMLTGTRGRTTEMAEQMQTWGDVQLAGLRGISLPQELTDQANAGLASVQEEMIPMGGMTAWHGSPHKFAPTAKNALGEFDLAKMGTGEGTRNFVVFDPKKAKIVGRNGEKAVDELSFLISEAKKYPDKDSFRNAFTQEHLTDLSGYEKHRYGRAIPSYADEKEWMDVSVDKLSTEYSGYLEDIKYTDKVLYDKVTTPSKKIKVYRAVPKDASDKLAAGDYVALDKRYADMHGESVLKGQQGVDYKVITEELPKSDVIWGQADWNEWAYSPKKLRDEAGSLEEIWDKANK